MSRSDRRHPLDPALERRLGELLRDSVADVQPEDRLGELRARASRPRRRPLLAVAGAALGTAAVVAAVAVGAPALLAGDPEPAPPAASPGEPPTDRSNPDEEASEDGGVPEVSRAVAGYYLGDTPAGVRLYREFRSVTSADTGPGASLELLTTAPADPDYRTAWPTGAFAGAALADDEITVELADPSLTGRPAGMDEEVARASVQQAVHTLQAYAQQRLPVRFTTADGPAEEVLGVATDGPVTAGPPLETLSLVNLTVPEEGQQVSRRLPVEGVANAYEATVTWTLRGDDGRPVDDGFFTASGWMGERLFPFSGTVDLAGLEPGTYELSVQAPDASGGTEGEGAFTDTRTVVVD